MVTNELKLGSGSLHSLKKPSPTYEGLNTSPKVLRSSRDHSLCGITNTRHLVHTTDHHHPKVVRYRRLGPNSGAIKNDCLLTHGSAIGTKVGSIREGVRGPADGGIQPGTSYLYIVVTIQEGSPKHAELYYQVPPVLLIAHVCLMPHFSKVCISSTPVAFFHMKVDKSPLASTTHFNLD